MVTMNHGDGFYDILCQDGRAQQNVHKNFVRQLPRAKYTDLGFTSAPSARDSGPDAGIAQRADSRLAELKDAKLNDSRTDLPPAGFLKRLKSSFISGAAHPVIECQNSEEAAQLLRQARARLEQEGYDVLAAWVSPSHDGYVGPKAGRLGTVHISSAFRLHLARLMLHGDDFVSVGAWEAQYDGLWPDFPVVAEALQRSLHDLGPALRGPSGKARVFYACGTDHAERCGLYRGLGPDIGVVVVPREGERPDAERPKSLVFVATAAPGELATYSSTKIRKALKEGDHAYVSNAISDAAAQFLLAPTPEDHACFKRDFRALGVRARE